MQNIYEPPDSELKTEELKSTSIVLIFVAANSGFLAIPAIVVPLLFFTAGFSFSGIHFYDIVGLFVVSAGCSLLAGLLIIPFRKIPLHWAAIAGTLLSIFFCFALVLLDELRGKNLTTQSRGPPWKH